MVAYCQQVEMAELSGAMHKATSKTWADGNVDLYGARISNHTTGPDDHLSTKVLKIY